MRLRLRRNAKSLVDFLKPPSDEDRHWPGYLLGGHVRTSTAVLIVAFLAAWWAYDTYRPQASVTQQPAQVVPPWFVPDPGYTWVPRTSVPQPPQTVTVTVTPRGAPTS